jgi:predicted transcriptional regulator
LSEAQLEIMNLVWDRGTVTVGEVWDELRARRNVARNTVQTLIVRLRDKGWLNESIDGSVYRYRATRQRQGTQRQLVARLLDTAFAGSAEGLIMAMLDGRRLSRQEARRIREIIDQAERGE